MRVSAYLKLKLMANRLTYVSSKSGQMFRVEAVWKYGSEEIITYL